jgi:hypothetical protein
MVQYTYVTLYRRLQLTSGYVSHLVAHMPASRGETAGASPPLPQLTPHQQALAYRLGDELALLLSSLPPYQGTRVVPVAGMPSLGLPGAAGGSATTDSRVYTHDPSMPGASRASSHPHADSWRPHTSRSGDTNRRRASSRDRTTASTNNTGGQRSRPPSHTHRQGWH